VKRYEEEADSFFRQDALEKGWLPEDPHYPGNGAGLWAYYRAVGIVPPEVLGRTIPDREKTGFDTERISNCE
jgi:hypothetical protein